MVQGNCTVGVLWLEEGAQSFKQIRFVHYPPNDSIILIFKNSPFRQELINDYHRKVLLERLVTLERLWFSFICCGYLKWCHYMNSAASLRCQGLRIKKKKQSLELKSHTVYMSVKFSYFKKKIRFSQNH